MLQDATKPMISRRARTNSKLAKKDPTCKNEFFYWLGYFNGQDDISNKENTEWE